MPFTDEQPFLDAIFARYHDDGPRFIYADFLDDAGDPARAELVRLQVALARMSEDRPGRRELVSRQDELLDAHRARWCQHLSDLLEPSECDFRRGVLDSVVIDAGKFLECGEELFERLPLRRLRLRGSSEVMPDLVKSPLLAQIQELDLFDNSLGNGGIDLLVCSQYLKELETLDLGFNGIDDVGARTLAKASTFPKLTSLSLSNDQINSVGLIELAESPFFAGLTALDVSSNGIDEAGLKAVITSKSFTRLHTLRLSDNYVGDGGVAALARSELIERMMARSTRLELRKNEIGSDGAIMLAKSAILSRCISLDLTDNSIGNAGLIAILRSQYLKSLEVLKVGGNQITDAAIITLRQSLPEIFAHLHVFDLSENWLTGHGIRILRAENGNGVVIDVSENNIASTGNETSVSEGESKPGVLHGGADETATAALRRRVSHPTMRAGERPNKSG